MTWKTSVLCVVNKRCLANVRILPSLSQWPIAVKSHFINVSVSCSFGSELFGLTNEIANAYHESSKHVQKYHVIKLYSGRSRGPSAPCHQLSCSGPPDTLAHALSFTGLAFAVAVSQIVAELACIICPHACCGLVPSPKTAVVWTVSDFLLSEKISLQGLQPMIPLFQLHLLNPAIMLFLCFMWRIMWIDFEVSVGQYKIKWQQ